MTHQEQLDLVNELKFAEFNRDELKLREFARVAVEGRGTLYARYLRIPVVIEGGGGYKELIVDFAPILRWEREDVMQLVAEAILRPQLRELGWKV